MTSTVHTGDSLPGPEQLRSLVLDAADSSIVVGLDGSPTSWDALSWALGEAKRRNSLVLVVHVIPKVELAAGAMAAAGASDGYFAIRRAETDAAEQLEGEAAAEGHRLGVPVVFVRAEGDSAHELVRVAQSAHSDLIVIGRSNKMRHRLAGSLGRRLVSNRQAPTVVVVP